MPTVDKWQMDVMISFLIALLFSMLRYLFLHRINEKQVDLEKFVQSRDELSGADIKAICTEAGMLALRERRMKVCQEDFEKAKEKALYRKKGNIPEGLYL